MIFPLSPWGERKRVRVKGKLDNFIKKGLRRKRNCTSPEPLLY